MVIVSRLTPGYFTEQVVLACQEAGWDPAFCTTLCADGPDLAAKLLRISGSGHLRRLGLVSPACLRTRPFRESVRLLAGRLFADEVLQDRCFYWMRDGFDAWVAGQMRPPVRMVYAHETECLDTFRAARQQGVRTVLDLPSPEHDFVEDLLWDEYAKFPDLLTPARRHFRSLQPERTARRREEFQLADAVVANSRFTARSWGAAGLPSDKICVVPLGAPDPIASGIEGGSRGQGPLRLVWAGTFSVRKGAHYLLAAWKKWNPGSAVQLDIFGTVRLPQVLLRDLPTQITFRGPVPRERLLDEFLRADLLVFPTLCDGFGLVVPEALSRALPVLTTTEAGASDFIDDRRNGLIVPSRDVEALASALEWAAANRPSLGAMREEALLAVAGRQWADYRQRLRQVLEPVMQ